MTETTAASRPVSGALRKRMIWLSMISSYLVVSAHLRLFTDLAPDLSVMRYVVAIWRYGVCSIPAEVFFVLSGYSFFRTYKHTWEGYRGKLQRRLYTLVIPYLSWISLRSLWEIVSGADALSASNWLRWVGVTAQFPVLDPLWYLRDLMLLCILSPVIYAVLRRKWLGRSVLIILWLLQWMSLSPYGHYVQGLLWFSVGTYVVLQIDQLSLERCNRPWLWLFGWLVMIAIVQSLRVRAGLALGYMAPLYVLTGLPVLWNLAGVLDNARVERTIGPYGFFIYCAHSFFNFPFSTIWVRLVPASEIGVGVGFFLVPMLSFISSLVSGKLGQAWFPRLYAIVTGGRGVRT